MAKSTNDKLEWSFSRTRFLCKAHPSFPVLTDYQTALQHCLGGKGTVALKTTQSPINSTKKGEKYDIIHIVKIAFDYSMRGETRLSIALFNLC